MVAPLLDIYIMFFYVYFASEKLYLVAHTIHAKQMSVCQNYFYYVYATS